MPLPDSFFEHRPFEELLAQFSGDQGKPPKRGEEIFEGVDYPRDWLGFIGQAQAKAQLRANVASSQARVVRMEHTLLASGLHGIGKTTLATLMAYQRGVGFQQTTGPLDVNEARELILAMEDCDVLFIDEAHKLATGSRTRSDWMLPFMTEGVLYTSRGAERMPNITVVAATTDVGVLPLTLISRFMCRPKLTAYTEDEATEIAFELAVRMGVDCDVDYAAIARASNGNPRDMRSILVQARELTFAYPDQPLDLAMAFEWAGLSADGLSQVAQDMLLVLLTSPDRTASIATIGSVLGEPGPLKHYEQSLLQRGFVTIGGAGRKLTDAGARRALALLEEKAA